MVLFRESDIKSLSCKDRIILIIIFAERDLGMEVRAGVHVWWIVSGDQRGYDL